MAHEPTTIEAFNANVLARWEQTRRKLQLDLVWPQHGDRAGDLLARNVWRGGDYELVVPNNGGLLRQEAYWLDVSDGTVIRHAEVAGWRLVDNKRLGALRAHLNERPKPALLCKGSGHQPPAAFLGPEAIMCTAGSSTLCGECELDVLLEWPDGETAVYVAHTDAGIPL